MKKKKKSNANGNGEKGLVKLNRRRFMKLTSECTAIGVGLAATYSWAQPEPPPLFPPPFPPANPPAANRLPDLVDSRFETWQEPWTFRPQLWTGSQLQLNVVENQNPGNASSPGNPTPTLYSFNGSNPGPTIRARAGGEVSIKLRNTMGLNRAETIYGKAPDPVEIAPDVTQEICSRVEADFGRSPELCVPFFFPEQLMEVVEHQTVVGWAIKGHLNGVHAAHVTNLHFHGLHVSPDVNEDGSHSDNVALRVLSQADWQARLDSGDPELMTLAPHEHVGELDYRIRLSFPRNGERLPHPPGTHWYHPHAHGATHDQVASGMAGYFIVEGDVDEAINRAMTGAAWPDPERATGPWDYRERMILLQRAFLTSANLDAGGARRNSLRFPPLIATNGEVNPGVFHLRPGAVERWRVLNASGDGSGTKRFMVLKGQFVHREQRLWRVTGGNGQADRRLVPATQQDLEDAKMPLQQLAFDGITLVKEENGRVRHTIRDLSTRNPGTQNPFATPAAPGADPTEAALKAFEACFRNGDSLRRSYVRPNEVFMANANRADVFFKAPLDGEGDIYTIFAQESHLHTDAYQGFLQLEVNGTPVRRKPLFDVVIGYISVRGDAVPGGDFDIQSLEAVLPPVPALLQPIHDEELRIPAREAARTGAETGQARTRVVSYSGTGGADFPLFKVPDEFVADNPDDENLVWATHNGFNYLMPNFTRTMGINTEFDLAKNPEPRAPRKFAPGDERSSRMLLDTAEEWVLYNNSQMLWGHTDLERYPQQAQYGLHYEPHLMSRAEGQRRFWENPEFSITVKGADHPFHIHINPMWVLRIDVPDENGELHNILPEPQWMDTVSIPRNGGRVVFRSRFEDFPGKWVHHCHILLHEDNGMMQEVECVREAERANYNGRDQVASHGMSTAAVNRIYPPPSPQVSFRQNMSFVDPNEVGYQEYPGFELEVPEFNNA